MERSESNPRDGAGRDACCEFGASLGAYHDGELDSSAMAGVEAHLATCEPCREELGEIVELSVLAGRVGSAGMSSAAMRRIHRAIDADEGYSLLRISVVLTSLAASAMIVGSVWLSEIPASRSLQPEIVVNPDAAPWTSVAMGEVRADRLPRTELEMREQPMLADNRLATWMLEGLSGGKER